MLSSVKDLHKCEIGTATYWLRTPTSYDRPLIRHRLGRQRLRRPSQTEFRVAGLTGLTALGEASGEQAEAARQRAVFERWHELLVPLSEDDIDEPDFELRAAEMARRGEEQRAEREAIFAEVLAIEASLSRHWSPYAELVADRTLFDEVSDIEVVRALLMRIGTVAVPRDEDERMTDAAYQALPPAHRGPLAVFAHRLLQPSETQRKN